MPKTNPDNRAKRRIALRSHALLVNGILNDYYFTYGEWFAVIRHEGNPNGGTLVGPMTPAQWESFITEMESTVEEMAV